MYTFCFHANMAVNQMCMNVTCIHDRWPYMVDLDDLVMVCSVIISAYVCKRTHWTPKIKPDGARNSWQF